MTTDDRQQPLKCAACGIDATDECADLFTDARGKTWCRDMAPCDRPVDSRYIHT